MLSIVAFVAVLGYVQSSSVDYRCLNRGGACGVLLGFSRLRLVVNMRSVEKLQVGENVEGPPDHVILRCELQLRIALEAQLLQQLRIPNF